MGGHGEHHNSPERLGLLTEFRTALDARDRGQILLHHRQVHDRLARSLGLRTVAEGVEDENTRQMLAAAGCTLAQGWLAARPMPARDLPGWLSGHDADDHRPGGLVGAGRQAVA